MPITIRQIKRRGMTLKAMDIISFARTKLSIEQAIPVMGDPPAVARANCVVRKSNKTMPISLKPTVPLNWTKTGIMMMVKIMLFAKLVMIVASNMVIMIKRMGGNWVKGTNMDASVFPRPVSGAVR